MEASDDLRERAIKKLKAKRAFKYQLLVFVGVSILFVVIWATAGDRGFFWPVFPIAAWGLFGIIPQWWRIYRGDSISEDQIQREMSRIGNDPEG